MCSNCRHDHDIEKDSYSINPRGGTLVAGPWFKDKQGLNHQATACLRCGTIHATAGAPLKAIFSLFSRPIDVKYYLTVEKFQLLIEKIAQDKCVRIDQALTLTGLPEIVLDGLASRGYLAFVENNLSTKHVSKISTEKSEEDIPNEEKIRNICVSFARVYILFCIVFSKDPHKDKSFEEFIQDSLTKDKNSEAFLVTAAVLYAIDRGYLQRTQLFSVIYDTAQFAKDAGLHDEFQKIFQ